jgi:glycosyltransferase involved in cell wall biosynthesis
LPEVGGDAAYYVNPNNAEEIAAGMKQINKDNILAEEMRERGWQQAQKFSPQKCAEEVMNVYRQLT